MLLVPSPWPIQRHPASSVFIASSLRQTPPPAVPTHSRHAPFTLARGEIASADDAAREVPEPLAPPRGARADQGWSRPSPRLEPR